MPGMSGEDLLRLLLEERPETTAIVVTATNDLETAVRCMRAGAFDYLTKPVDRTRLLTSLRHAIEQWETAGDEIIPGRNTARLKTSSAFGDIVTADRQMLQIFPTMWKRSLHSPPGVHYRRGDWRGEGARGADYPPQREEGKLRHRQHCGSR